MGTPLPAKFKKDDGSGYQSGTEWEFEDALKAAEQNGQPTILLYRPSEEPTIGLGSADYHAKRDQYQRVDAFFENLKGDDGSLTRTMAAYARPEGFRKLLQQNLEHVVSRFLGQGYSEELGVSRPAFERFLAILDEQDVPPEQFEAKLEEIAKRHKELTAKLHALSRSNDEPAIGQLREQAAEAIDQGDYDRADELLVEADDIDLRAIDEHQEQLDRRKLSAAATRSQRGELERTRLNYRKAAEHFAEAANLAASADRNARLGYLMQQASVLYDHGREFGENQTLVEAIDLYRLILKERTRERVPLDWAMTQENLGLAYSSMAEKSRDEAVLLQGIEAIKAALEVFEEGEVAYNIEKAKRNLAGAEAMLAEIRGEGSAG